MTVGLDLFMTLNCQQPQRTLLQAHNRFYVKPTNHENIGPIIIICTIWN